MLAVLSLPSPTQSTIYRFNFSVTHLEIRGILVLKLKTISVPGKLMNKKYRLKFLVFSICILVYVCLVTLKQTITKHFQQFH